MSDPEECRTVCRTCGIRESVLFGGLEERDLLPIQDAIEERSLEPHQVLYRMGDSAKAVFTIRRGLIKLVQYLPDGGQRIVRLVRNSDVVGLEALLDQVYQHEAIVVHPVLLCRIPVEVILRLSDQKPALHRELMSRWQRALSEADAWLTELSTGSAQRRVARLLMRLVNDKGEGCCALFNRRDMGAMLGVTTESASRAIAELKRMGIVEEGPWGFRAELSRLQDIAIN